MDSDTEETRSQVTATKAEPSKPSRKHKKRKKLAAEADPEKPKSVQATIKVIPGNPERIPPLVGYFPSGFDPTQNPDQDSTKVGVFRHKERGGTRLQVVVTPNKEAKVDFVGTSYAGEAQAGELCSYGLGILDKDTQTLKIVPIASNKIFRLEPKIQGLHFSGKEPASSAMGELSVHEKAEKRIDLHNRYGTKKSIRQNKKMQTLKQEDDPDSQNDMDAIKQGMTNREDTEASEGHTDRNTPPFNASATTPQEAYPLDKIITTGEWKFLQDINKLLEGGAEISQNSFPTFVCNRIHKLQLIEDEDKKYKLSCIFSYITHLIKFKDLHSMDGFSSAKAHRFPGIIRDKFSSMFDAVSKRLSTEKSNLLISYVLVLTLFADEFQTSMTDIAKDLRMGTATLRTHYEKLGCKVSKKNVVSTVTLPVPLQFPTVRRKRRN
ncbi:putative RNA polymerase I associated factor, A49 [Rosa chinensis]|uniref:Putative RNA polymerase I associated factor, A49 n=1 Tax=Rosa chinensis TaxID=74649 RepID=A0A2P6RYE2_ROSCH|nr:DNA-directed RNA polymerase I subunit rpa49 [Rosa chinensis]PRQ51446.1 putative RNA polymerase I associated factor, A49 [Rosa chinensis]